MVSPKVHFLLPGTNPRFMALDRVLKGYPCAERYLFYGLDHFLSNGIDCSHSIKAKTNIKFNYFLNRFHRAFFCNYYGYGGRLDWILPSWNDIKKADCCIAVTAHVAFPLIQYQVLGLLPKKPVFYIAIGLPERLSDIYSSRPSRYEWWIKHLNKLAVIVSLSLPEKEVLEGHHGINNVIFIPTGVDTSYFSPVMVSSSVDVLSIGGDKHRDFATLLQVAEKLPQYKFKIITNEYHFKKMSKIPNNVEICLNIPMDEIKNEIAISRCLALPVKDNEYTGATTVLLQAMSMAKTVIANPVGANIRGYGFKNKENIVFVDPESCDQLKKEIDTCLRNQKYTERIGYNARKTTLDSIRVDIFHSKLLGLITNYFNKNDTF